MRAMTWRVAPPTPIRMALVSLLLAAPGCGPGRRTAGEALFPYIDAVQAANHEMLRCLYAGQRVPGGPSPTDEVFNAWVDRRLAAFDAEKARGQADLDDDGIVMIKALGLGTGTLVGISSVAASGDGIDVLTPATFNYDQIDAPSLPNGATFLVAVLPVGTVTTVRVQEGSGRMALDALKSLTLRWTLKRVERRGSCHSEWGVASVAVVPGSAKVVRVEWTF
ncbi:MAG: hypothetical protein LAO51_01795 [Acidobacteriia bacterium]|nr:hypothetical protein [Terriglobia bacterium]